MKDSPIRSLFLTYLSFIFFEVLATSLNSLDIFLNLKLDFNVMYVLFLVLFVNATNVGFYILILQFMHSAFSVEGWAIGSFLGACLVLLVDIVREWVIISSSFSLFLYSFIFHFFWYSTTILFFYLKIGQMYLIEENFFSLTLKSFVFAIISIPVFGLLRNIWKIRANSYKVISDVEG